MREIKFTKGPWKFTNRRRAQISADNGKQICSLLSSGNTQANANLIAAAPDMYDALEAIVRCCESREQWNDDPVRFAAIANAALRKSRGEL